MIRARLQYFVKDRKSFEDKVLPYVFGGGIFYKEVDAKPTFEQNQLSVEIETNTLSQLVTVSTGMLRYSPNCVLEKIDVLHTDKIVSKTSGKFNIERALLGIIIKPSLSFKSTIAKQLIEASQKKKVDFVKDDDASEYSKKEAEEILKLAGNVSYLQKIVEPQKIVSDFSMIVPWVDGWKLLQDISEKSVTASHCAVLSPQVSWYSHIIFSRLAGASLVIVPDPAFDEKFNLKLALEAASKQISGANSTRLIISGGINPSRIKNLLKEADKKHHKYVGFAVGSWVLSNSKNISENIEVLKKEIMK
ncbi:hypothetical protein K9L97_01760 [Candidatus Woesearchaeota archaeon]|nr:hypothetical protein [Candidatus Woesearchaeota archaeon]